MGSAWRPRRGARIRGGLALVSSLGLTLSAEGGEYPVLILYFLDIVALLSVLIASRANYHVCWVSLRCVPG